MKRSLMVMAVMTGLMMATPVQAQTRVAVLDLEAGPGAGVAARRISKAIRRQVANTSGLAIAAGKTLAEIKLIFGCTERPSRAYHRCLAKAGTSMKANKIIVGKVRHTASGYKVVITLVDVARPLRPQTVSGQIRRSGSKGSALRRHTRVWVARLFGRAHAGSLAITCSTDGVKVSVGGNVLGTCSTSRTKITLSPGTHKVIFTKDGFKTASHMVSISLGRTSRLNVDLAKRIVHRRLPPDDGTTPGVKPPAVDDNKKDNRLAWKVLFYSTLSAGVALLAGSIITGLKVSSLEDDKIVRIREIQLDPLIENPGVADACKDNSNDPELIDICNKGVTMARTTNILIGVGAALLASSGLFLYFAYIAKGSSKEKATSLNPTFDGPGKTRIMVTPQIYVRGGGLSATLRF
jgi:PEGA domain